jgi:acyl transferase domain-containing protein/acyl carrier protein
MLRAAWRDANVSARQISYIEAHGTGTLVGDPVEIESIGTVLSEESRKKPCIAGSVKTNIGHTESAAGVAGVIKVALSLQQRRLPATLHFKEPNPAISWDELPVIVESKTEAWNYDAPTRIAGVSGFGITGTNAHIVLEEVEPVPHTKSEEAHLFALSARTPEALHSLAASWHKRLKNETVWPQSMADLAYTSTVRRTHHDSRLAITASTREELGTQLAAWMAHEETAGLCSGERKPDLKGRAVFVFPGQGGQWVGMGQSLFVCEPAFRAALQACDEAIRECAGWSVIERLMAPSGNNLLQEIDVVQPALFAVMVSVTALLRTWGMEPAAVVGHSMGESVAAYVSGALSLGDAVAVICHRSRLMRQASGRGLMAVAELNFKDATRLAEQYNGQLSVAAQNSPMSTVFSGDSAAIEDLVQKLEAQEIFSRRIKVDVASHCAHMDSFCRPLAERLSHIKPRFGTIPFYSTTTGQIEDGTKLHADYWSRNLRQPVLFSSAIQTMLRDGYDTFIEINAHPVLLHAIEAGIRHQSKPAIAVATLKRDRPERAELLNAIGALYVNGVPLVFSKLYPEGISLRTPKYPWQRERHWLEEDTSDSKSNHVSRNVVRHRAADCLYELTWAPLPEKQAADSTGLWLLFGPPGITKRVGELLDTQGDHYVCAGDIKELQLCAASHSQYRGVVVFSDATDPEHVSQDTYRAVQVVQILTNMDQAASPRFYMVTTGCWKLPGDHNDITVAQGPIWGLGRVIVREHPELRCTNIDLSVMPEDAELMTLATFLRTDEVDDQIAIRAKEKFGARLERTKVIVDESQLFSGDATYLITGGLGGIGLKVAAWMFDRGAKWIALAGRRGPSDTAEKEIERMCSLGATIKVFAADVSDEKQVAALLKQIAATMPKLKGIFHAAAVLEDQLIRNISQDHLEKVFASKTIGAWNLHVATESLPLDSFVLFSSMTAAISQPGQGSYAAANAFLDALARFRSARGQSATSIQWGLWDDTGLANVQGTQKSFLDYKRRGIDEFNTETALECLELSLRQHLIGCLALPVRWEQFSDSFDAGSVPLVFSRLTGAKDVAPTNAEAISIKEKLLVLPTAPLRRALLESHIKEILATVLKTKAARLDPAKTMGSFGVDSLIALEFVRRLAKSTSVTLSATTVFNYPTIQLLTMQLATRMGIDLEDIASNTSSVVAEAHSVPAAELSEEDAIHALMSEKRASGD